MDTQQPILVTGAAGQVGGIGGIVGNILLRRQVPVRAFVGVTINVLTPCAGPGQRSLWVISRGPKTLHAQ
jgi:hypothetical protein